MSQVSEQVLSSLLAKQVLAASPGVAATDLYYSSTNSKKEIIPSTTYVGRYVQSLQSQRWGTSSQIVVPSTDMLGQVYMRITMQKPSGCYVSQGWGYNCIQQISYIWGSSNTSQLTITKDSILGWLSTSSEPMNEQFTEMMYQGGALTELAADGVPPDELIEATLVLPLPMSTLCPHKPPFDLSLLSGSSPMIIRIDLAQSPRYVMGGPTVNIDTAEIKTAEVIFTNTTVLDTSLSLSSQLRADPSLIASYPFIHLQSFQSGIIQATTGNTGFWGGVNSSVQTVNLTSFLRSDLIGIIFTLIDQRDVQATQPAVNTRGFAPTYLPQDMLDFEVLYNGQRLYYTPGYSGQLIGMRGRRGAGYFTTYRAKTGVHSTEYSPSQSEIEIYSYPVTMITTHKGAADLCDSFDQPNTSRFPNQVLNVRFLTPSVDKEAAGDPRDKAPEYILNCTYIYSALAEVDSKGQCAILFS